MAITKPTKLPMPTSFAWFCGYVGALRDALSTIIDGKADKVQRVTITIATSAWTANADAETLAEGYAYKADVEVTGLAEQDDVDVTLTVPSLAIAAAAEMSPSAVTSANNIRFFAKAVPTSALSAQVDVIQGEEPEEQEE